jgi:LDH2 family malate/lactate/ureidoglycolate dehydrogenase
LPRLDGHRLEGLIRAEFERAGLCEESATWAARGMVETSMRGIDSHGVNLFPHYLRAVRSGRINSNPAIRTVQRRAATALLDADHAIGHHAGSAAIALAMELAAQAGMGAVAVANSTHFGAAGFFALQASRAGHIGFAFTNADALIRAFGGRRALFGSNPICITAPMEGEEPLCLDMTTSRVSWNKVVLGRRAGEPLPPGLAADASGAPTTDPAAAAMLEPIGDYKGYGLSLLIEVLCAMLADGPVGLEILPMYRAPIEARRRISHFFMAMRVDAFLDLQHFRSRLRSVVERTRAEDGGGRVMVPGDPEKRAFAARQREGIPMLEEPWREFLAISPAFESALVS